MASGKARAYCPTFPGAERHKAEVCDLPSVLMGDILPPGGRRRLAQMAGVNV